MSRFCVRTTCVLIAIVAFAATAVAQTPAVIDPRIVEFDPSPDHAVNSSDGQPVVTRYELELYVVGGTQPVQVANLGKPAAQSDGKIRVDFTTLLSPWPAAGTTYEARVAAIGPNGTGRSTESNTFAFSSPCSSSISPTSVSVGGAASTGSVTVTGVPGCPWSATSAASWITITAGASGSGNGTVSYSVAANTTSNPRSGSLSIAGQTFTVNQNAGCTFTINPTASSISSAATTGTVSLTTLSGCGWTASSSVSWITVTSGASGSGPGSVGYSVAANTATSPRSGTVTIGGRAFTVNQEGVACTFSLSPVSATLGPNAGTATVAVTAANGCAWTATSNTSWISVTGGASGNGNGQVTYSVGTNPGTSSRNGTITIGGQTLSVTQSGQACTFSVAPVSASVPANATSGSVSVDTLAGCAWTATSSAPWISITSGASGSGDGTVAYDVAANPNLASRSGTLTVGGQTVTVNQAGVVCTATIAPVSASVGSGGAQGSVNVTIPAACSWSATSGASWITITGGGGPGSGAVTYTVAANTSTSSRSANLTIAGQTFGVTQAGITCSFQVTPTVAAATAAAGTGSVTVFAANGCAWSASSSAPWITITSGASDTGQGTVGYSFQANPTTQTRSGTLTVAGTVVTVNQAAGCGYSISPASASLTASAGSGSVNVTAGGTCAWTAQSSVSWVTFGAPGGTGSGSAGYSVAANPDSSSRSTTVTVAGQPFVITQAGAACDASLNPANQNIAAAGGNGSVDITVPGGCGWSAVPSVSWISILTGASGAGSGNITYRVDANPAGTSRSGTIAIGGRLLNVTQAAALCSATVSSTNESFEAPGGSRVVSVTIPTGCVWTAISNSSWISITAGAGPNSSGSGGVTFLVAPNTSTAPRSGSITASGRTVTVNQAGTCDITLSPNGVSAGSDAASGSVAISTGGSCGWSATSSASWLTVVGTASGTGDGSVLYSISANTTNSSRTATLTIGGRTFTVTQSAPACAAVLSTTSVSLTAASAFRTVGISTGSTCAWTAVSSVPWITIPLGGSGTGVGSISYNVSPNPDATPRTGTITIAGATLTVSQAGISCNVSTNPTSVAVPAAATTGSVAVMAPAGCPWTSSTNVAWLTLTSSGSGDGNGSVQYAVAPNSTGFSRFGNLTIGGRTLLVTQAASSCSATLSSIGVSVGAQPQSVPVDVWMSGDCEWSTSSSVAWIAVSGGTSGSGTATVTVAANTGTGARSGTVSIAGRSFTVNQTGACDYVVSPTAVTVGGGNSLAFIWVTAGSGCAWTAQSSASWITLSTSAGQGVAVVNVTVAANMTTSPRSATVTVAGETVTVTQAGATCNYSVSPGSLIVSGGTHTLTVTAPDGCAWTASATATWIRITSSTSGAGSGTLTVVLDPNPGPTSRLGFINVAGWRVMVNQRMAVAPSAPTGLTVRPGGPAPD